MIARIDSDAYGHVPTDYGELRQLAFRFGMEELADRTFINHATQLCIEVTPEALKAATRSGTPSDLLLALSALPFLLAQAEYRRSIEGPRRRRGVRQIQVLSAPADICDRRCNLLIAVRENLNGQCFFDRMIEQRGGSRYRDLGGEVPDAVDESAPENAPASAIASADANGELLAQRAATTAQDRARVIFGETSGLYPHLIDPDGPRNDPRNWDTDSVENLAAARKYVGIAAGRTAAAHAADPDLANPIEARAWSDAARAAAAAHVNPNLLDGRIDRFYLRGDADDFRPFPERRRYLTIGPFYNIGGGDVARGNNMYIEFYGRK